jgi:hypothetical protein
VFPVLSAGVAIIAAPNQHTPGRNRNAIPFGIHPCCPFLDSNQTCSELGENEGDALGENDVQTVAERMMERTGSE